MDIRSYQSKDEANLIALWQDCNLVKSQNNPQFDIARKLKVDPDLLLVGLEGNQIIASVMGGYEGHRGWINYLAVAPNKQRQGYGEKMMNAIETRLKAKGCPKINLQVRSSNQQVLSFYHALGYIDDEVISLGKRLEK